jgi:hypothetical protein
VVVETLTGALVQQDKVMLVVRDKVQQALIFRQQVVVVQVR